MSNLWWLQPGWTSTKCGNCGAKIWPEGDPDWGLCWTCMQERHPLQQQNEEIEEEEEHE